MSCPNDRTWLKHLWYSWWIHGGIRLLNIRLWIGFIDWVKRGLLRLSSWLWRILSRIRLVTDPRLASYHCLWSSSLTIHLSWSTSRLPSSRTFSFCLFVVELDANGQIVQLQHKKLAMTEAALSTDPDAALGKLTVEDVSPLLWITEVLLTFQLGFLFKM